MSIRKKTEIAAMMTFQPTVHGNWGSRNCCMVLVIREGCTFSVMVNVSSGAPGFFSVRVMMEIAGVWKVNGRLCNGDCRQKRAEREGDCTIMTASKEEGESDYKIVTVRKERGQRVTV